MEINVAQAIAFFRQLYRRRWPRDPVKSFDELFPNETRYHSRPEETIYLPGCDGLPEFHESYVRDGGIHIGEDFVSILSDVTFCPKNSAFMNSDGYLLRESFTPRLRDDPHKYPLYMERSPIELSGYSMPLRATWHRHFHTLVDAAPRLLSLHSPPLDELDKIQLLCPSPPNSLEQFLVNKVAPSNCEIKVLDNPKRLYKAEKMIFTSFKSRGGYVRADYLLRLRKLLLPKRIPRPYRRILISRGGDLKARRQISNFGALESGLRRWGFETVSPESLSIEQEIALFFDAEIIVGAHGSGLTNMIFAHRTAIVELFSTRKFVPVFYELCMAVGHRYAYVMGNGDDLYPVEYEVDIEAVEREVIALLGPS